MTFFIGSVPNTKSGNDAMAVPDTPDQSSTVDGQAAERAPSGKVTRPVTEALDPKLLKEGEDFLKKALLPQIKKTNPEQSGAEAAEAQVGLEKILSGRKSR